MPKALKVSLAIQSPYLACIPSCCVSRMSNQRDLNLTIPTLIWP